MAVVLGLKKAKQVIRLDDSEGYLNTFSISQTRPFRAKR